MAEQNRSMDSFWMPFTGNRAFKKNPRLVERAKGMYYYKPDGSEVLDMIAGLWCCNAGHGHPKIVEAIQKQITRLGNPYLVIRSIIEGETRRQNIRPQELDVAASLVTGAIMQMIDMRIYGSLKGSLAQHANTVADACVAILEA